MAAGVPDERGNQYCGDPIGMGEGGRAGWGDGEYRGPERDGRALARVGAGGAAVVEHGPAADRPEDAGRAGRRLRGVPTSRACDATRVGHEVAEPQPGTDSAAAAFLAVLGKNAGRLSRPCRLLLILGKNAGPEKGAGRMPRRPPWCSAWSSLLVEHAAVWATSPWRGQRLLHQSGGNGVSPMNCWICSTVVLATMIAFDLNTGVTHHQTRITPGGGQVYRNTAGSGCRQGLGIALTDEPSLVWVDTVACAWSGLAEHYPDGAGVTGHSTTSRVLGAVAGHVQDGPPYVGWQIGPCVDDLYHI